MPSPRYIRAIIFNNQTGSQVLVTCAFKSGESLNYNIPPGTHKIEKTISQGSFGTVDAIIRYRVQVGQQMHEATDSDANSIEIRQISIFANGQVQRIS